MSFGNVHLRGINDEFVHLLGKNSIIPHWKETISVVVIGNEDTFGELLIVVNGVHIIISQDAVRTEECRAKGNVPSPDLASLLVNGGSVICHQIIFIHAHNHFSFTVTLMYQIG